MDKDQLRKADFKTGVFLIAFCLWYLVITFAFMPFKETYGGVENVWYVSPWIFPAVILTLLLLLSLVLTINAILSRGLSDVITADPHRPGSFQLTRTGVIMLGLLVVASGSGLVYLVINIEAKIQFTMEEAKWLADASLASIFSWSNPLAVIPLTATTLVFLTSAFLFVRLWLQRRLIVQPASGDAKNQDNETRLRFAIIAILFCILVYVLVPNIDFFIGILLFLTVFTSSFHVEDLGVVKTAMTVYIATGIAVLLLFTTGLDEVFNAAYFGVVDLLVLTVAIAWSLKTWRQLNHKPAQRRQFRTCLLVSWITPLVLIPVFRFGLLVPLPHEGAVIELMHQLRYFMR